MRDLRRESKIRCSVPSFKLRNDVLAGGRRDILERRIREKIESRSQADPTRDRQRKALADLEGKITQGAKRIILVPDDVVDAVAAELSRMRRERDQLAEQSKSAERTKPFDVESDVKAALDKMWTIALAPACSSAGIDPSNGEADRALLRHQQKRVARRKAFF